MFLFKFLIWNLLTINRLNLNSLYCFSPSLFLLENRFTSTFFNFQKTFLAFKKLFSVFDLLSLNQKNLTILFVGELVRNKNIQKLLLKKRFYFLTNYFPGLFSNFEKVLISWNQTEKKLKKGDLKLNKKQKQKLSSILFGLKGLKTKPSIVITLDSVNQSLNSECSDVGIPIISFGETYSSSKNFYSINYFHKGFSLTDFFFFLRFIK